MTGRVAILTTTFALARAVEAPLADAGVDFVVATRASDAVALAQSDACDVMVLESGPASPDGLALRQALKAARPDLSILAVCLGNDPSARLRALDGGADEIMGAGTAPTELILRVSCLTALKAARAEAARLCSIRPSLLTESDPRPSRILVLDPDERSRTRAAEILAGEFAVAAVADASRGLIATAEGAFDVALVGTEAASDALAVARQLRLVDPAGSLRVIAICDAPLEWPLGAMLQAGIDDLVLRPVDRCELLARTRVAAARRRFVEAERARATAAGPSALRAWRSSGPFPRRFAA